MSDVEINAFVFGAIAGMSFMVFAFAILTRLLKPKAAVPTRRAPPGASRLVPLLIAVFFVSVMMFGNTPALSWLGITAAYAQTPLPIPTLDIPIAELFSQTNFWMATLSPVISIAVGAGIAVGLLLFVAAIIKSSFRGLG